MKKILLTCTQIAMILLLTFGMSSTTHALGDYEVLTPLPGTTKCTGSETTGCKTDFATYLPGLFKLMIGVAAVLAFVMITLGGLTYMTSDAISGKEEGRTMLENAIYGLLLVIGAYAILYTINPQILKFQLTIPKPSLKFATGVTFANIPTGSEGIESGGNVKPGYPLSDADVAKNTEMVNDLNRQYGIQVNHDACAQGQTQGCTNLVGLPANAYKGIVDVNNLCSGKCGIVVSGGTEGGHSSHGPGLAVVDLSDNAKLNDYISKNGGTPAQTKLGPQYTMTVGGQTVTFLKETDGGNHWHVVFK